MPTHEELKFWGGVLPYPVTITDDNGYPLGILYPDGTSVYCQPSKVGESFGEDLVVTWDGAKPDPSGGHSKGRLLPVEGPRYIDSLIIFKHMWNIGDEDDSDETTARTRKSQRRSAQGDS